MYGTVYTPIFSVFVAASGVNLVGKDLVGLQDDVFG